MAFEKLLNFRDVAISINKHVDEPLIKTGLLYRSARLDEATAADREHLLSHYHIRTILDLRTPTEHQEAKRKHATVVAAGAIVPPPFKIPGIRYEELNFNGSAYSKALVKQLSYARMAKLFGLYALGYRKEAISVLGQDVMAQRGLHGLAEDSLTHCSLEVKAVFDILTTADSYPLLVHCTQGKDRTGLIVLLVLMLLGVPQEAIQLDYVKSERELEPERLEKLAEIRSIGLPDDFADCPVDWVAEVSGWLDEHYGGADSYLQVCGMTTEQLGALRDILILEE